MSSESEPKIREMSKDEAVQLGVIFQDDSHISFGTTRLAIENEYLQVTVPPENKSGIGGMKLLLDGQFTLTVQDKKIGIQNINGELRIFEIKY